MKKERPEELQSKTFKKTVACGSLFITVGFNGNPWEIFLNGGKTGTCRANLESLARILTLAFQSSDIMFDEIIDQLKGLRCDACSRKIAKSQANVKQRMPWSCSDAVARVLDSLDCKKEN